MCGMVASFSLGVVRKQLFSFVRKGQARNAKLFTDKALAPIWGEKHLKFLTYIISARGLKMV
jgi:hypothetical protein